LGGEGTRHYFSDGLNSVTALGQQPTTTSSSLTAAYEYDAWGNYFSTSGGSNNTIGYTGQRFDGETGLMPLGNGERYYSPTLGSFIQQDSFTGMASMAQSMNRYAYAHGNPLRFIDRNGNKIDEPTNDPEAVSNVAEGAGNFLWNLLEPLRQIADVLVADAAANEGIDAKYVKMSSNLGKSSQEAVLAGQDPWDVALNSIHGQIRGYATLGLEQLAEPFSDMAAYYDGRISLPEYNKRMGGHLAGAGLFYVGARAARGGAGRAKPGVLAEKPTALASERLPLSRSATGDAPPMQSKPGPSLRASNSSATTAAEQIGPSGNPGGLGTLENRIPHGFKSVSEFESFGARLKGGLREAGYTDVEAGLQGSAVTGSKFTTGARFDVGRISDFDIALSSPELLARARQVGVPLRSGGIRTAPLELGHLKSLGLADLSRDLSQTAGRPVNFMIFDSAKTARSKAPTIGVP
jgi:RHS repeat-associated protein